MNTKSESTQEHIKFDTEVGKILQLMIHSLYANKDIFLRELISNSSDACDKLRYLSITNPELTKDDSQFKIRITADEAKRTLTITDNGIGMNREDLIENIGTIARSGTQNFASKLTGDNSKDLQLIGQFGVGFYSAFMVADKIEVMSCKAGEKNAWLWQSKGDGEYIIEKLSQCDLTRGTSVILHLKPEEDIFLDKFRIRHVIKTYSDHIAFPIEFTPSEGETEVLNNASAIWMRPKNEITPEQHNEFYKQVSHLPDSPWDIIHNKNEGMVEFTNLLYIPASKPFDLFNPDRRSKLKLYIKRVFIGSEGIDLAPSYLRFLHGVIDSEDLPLNINRETLQHSHSLEKIRKALTKKVISELNSKMNKDRENYLSFWNNFGAVLKEGLCEALVADEREKLLEVCLFKSALHNKLISLAEYIDNMKDGQNTIFYLSADDPEKAQNSPQLEGFIKRDIDVLLFTDTVDDFWVSVIHNFKDKELKSVTRSGIELDSILKANNSEEENSKEPEVLSDNDQKLIDYFKKVLGGLVMDVKISKKLVDSPVCLTVAEGAMDIRMERYLKDQKQLHTSFAKILEINSNHSIISKITQEIHKGDNLADELILALFDQSCIMEGEPIKDMHAFAKRMNNLLGRI
ncbi:MAG: molecular chaperone HtpG [Rickettsiales bacterium]